MNLEEFKASAHILPKEEAHRLRLEYVRRFVRTGTQLSKEYLGPLEGRPGAMYRGYLWDLLQDPLPIDFEFVQALVGRLGGVLVMWDLHADDRVMIPGYWKFGKDEVLSLDYDLLMDNLQQLPEDIYIFDRSFAWTLVLTHEDVDGRRWCLRSGDVPRAMPG